MNNHRLKGEGLKMAFLSPLFLISFVLFGQNPNRNFVSAESDQHTVVVKTQDGKYIFRPYTPEIMETSFVPKGEDFTDASHAVVLKPLEVNFTLEETSEMIFIDTDGIDVEVSKMPFQVTYYFKGEKLTSEKQGYSKGEKYEKLDFNLTEAEVLMGGGARALGMDRRGNRLELYNRAHYGYGTKSELLNFTLPVAMSSRKYLIHFDNAPIGFLDLDSEHSNILSYETISGRKTYQIVAGNAWEDIVSNFTLLTGRQPLPPRWALGNFSSRFGYHSQQEVMETIEKFNQEEIPVDAVILDLYWFGKEMLGTMGNLAFEKDSFPAPKKMIGSLAKKGVKTVLVTEPFILTTSNRWEEAVSNNVLAKDSLGQPFRFDFYFGNTGLVDIFDPVARTWFWNIYEDLAKIGVAGWWGDLGEPEVHPEALQHINGSANEVHNIYGHYWAKMLHEGYEDNFPEARPFILMRAGAAGSQRFGLIPWSGDVSRAWEGLKSQPEISLQMGLQGLAYMHSDLGGFAGANLDDDLYARWLQYGVFQPVYRPHAQEDVASEPVFRAERPKELAKKAIELRYRLLPYNYTLAFKNSVEGMPLMRPMFFEEPENFRLYSVANQYLWGHEFLVAPVVRPNITKKDLYFPKTSNWFDFYTGQKYAGGTTKTIEVKEEYIPTFVRGGAFVPMSSPIQNTGEFSATNVEIHYFFDAEVTSAQGTLYHDDGSTKDTYKKGDFELLNFRGEETTGGWTFEIEKKLGAARKVSDFGKTKFIIHNLPEIPKEILVGGKKVQAEFEKSSGKLILPVVLENEITRIIINL